MRILIAEVFQFVRLLRGELRRVARALIRRMNFSMLGAQSVLLCLKMLLGLCERALCSARRLNALRMLIGDAQ